MGLLREVLEPPMEFGILGPLEVRDGSGPVRVPGGKERALLAELLVQAGRVVSADRLIEDLWGDDPPGNPANALQGRVSALRRALGPAGAALIVNRPPGYALEVDPGQVDAARFQRLVATARRAAGPDAVGALEAALGLWRGPALVEFADRPWAQAEAARLEELRLEAAEALAELRLATGGHGGLVGELEALVAAHPTRERLRGLLMVALYRAGRQAEALGVYQRGREVLVEELGVDPSPELQRLHQAILVQDPALDGPDRAPAPPPSNLPDRLTTFVGREPELAELAGLVERHRLVTVTGPGGVGKTSLAVEGARRLVDRFPDGVWLVELAGLADPGLLAGSVAAALGLGAEPAEPGARPRPPVDRLAGFVADKALLVVLDNCEHLVAACAGLVRRLLEAGPAVRVLATSREVLGVPGEAVWPLPPLAVPDPAGLDLDATADPDAKLAPEALGRFDAVRLFCERAATANPAFALDAANAAAVAEITARLDGLPLAIELAAARVRALPPAELAARLEDRFRLLAAGGRTVGARQQTLRATIDWSWELLEGPDRVLWRRLSVFSGGFTLPAAEAVCGGDGLDPAGVLEGLVGLVDRSVVVAVGGSPARFRLLESLRAYGAERLAEAGEAEAVADRHTRWFLDLAEQGGHGYDQRWLRRVAAEDDNLRAVLDRAMAAPDPDTALRLAGALGRHWAAEHHDEGRRRVEAALAMAAGRPPTPWLARALQTLARLDVLLGPTAASVAAARRSVELFEGFGDVHAAAISKLFAGQVELQAGDGRNGARLLEEAETTLGELGDRWGEAYARGARFTVASFFGEPSQAYTLAEQALEGLEAVGDQRGRAELLFILGMAARFAGRLDEATHRNQEALAAARAAGPAWVRCSALVELGSLAALRGEDAAADAMHAEAAALARRTGMRRGTAHVCNELGLVARARGQPERAVALHTQALAIHRAMLPTRVPRTLAQLGCAEARLGRLEAAEAHLREGATLALAAPQPPTAALLLVGFAWVAAGRGDPERAARLLGAAAAIRERFGVPAVGAERAEADLVGQAVAATLAPEALAAAQAAGRALTPDEALRAALG